MYNTAIKRKESLIFIHELSHEFDEMMFTATSTETIIISYFTAYNIYRNIIQYHIPIDKITH